MTSTQQKKVSRRKKRISKHVLKAKEEQQQQQQQETSTKEKSPKKPKRKKSKHVKDPNEAAAYLSAWKHRDAGSAWKFNKNTQSWLLRHQYEPDKVSKGTFGILLEYMEGLQGQTRTRTIADAKKRALRYKEYEKSNETKETEDTKEEEEVSKESVEDEDDEARWKGLDDHQKRKEYKRARKVLDVLKE